jgi:FAD/FMN-containing dehydrogenase
MAAPSPQAISELKQALGPEGWSEDPDVLAPHLREWRDRWQGQTPILLKPGSTAEVAAAVAICARHRVAITPQGGNTGLVGGQIPMGELLLTTRRLRAIRDVSPLDDALIVEAGVTLYKAQQAALSVDRRFPLSLASEGTATIGGVLSTNAGGTSVLRYGMARDQVLGLEAVLADGRVFSGLKRLRKDNTGYDLKQLLIGAEGTLGIITAATLKLSPVLRGRATAIVGLETPQQAVALLARAKAESGGGVEAFELMKRLGTELVLKWIPDTREPLESAPPWSVLIELGSGDPDTASAALERLLAGAFEDGLIEDAAIAANQTQAQAFWRLREEQSAGLKPEGGGWKHDVSVPVSQIAAFIDEASAAVEAFEPGARISVFGHVGDGNLHYDVLCPEGADLKTFLGRWEAGSRIVHDIVARYDGSISAEHGLGRLKTDEARRYKSEVEIETLQAVRRALDPLGILNPGVLF